MWGPALSRPIWANKIEAVIGVLDREAGRHDEIRTAAVVVGDPHTAAAAEMIADSYRRIAARLRDEIVR